MFTIKMSEIDRIAQIYERQAQDCVHGVSRLYEEIIELARKTTYAPMVEFGNQIYRFYTGDLKDHLMREYGKWYDGPYSFHALMASINAGSSAVAEAKRRMDDMKTSLEGLFRLSQSEIHLDNSVPNIEDRDFEEYRTCLQSCRRNFERATGEAESAIRGMESGNDVVQLIGDIVKTTGVSLTESFGEMIREVTEGQDFTNAGNAKTLGAVTGRGIAADTHIPWGKNASFL